MQPFHPTTIEECFTIYLRKCEVKNISPKTLKVYNTHIKEFIKRSNATLIADVTETTIDDYILYKRSNTTCNAISINSYLRSVRAFLYWCMEQGYLTPFRITIPKAEKKIKETYTDYELSLLLAKPNVNKVSFNRYKIWALSNYLFATGNRISSALSIKIKDLDFENNMITIQKTKNRKQQIIPMSKVLKDILIEYLSYRKGNGEDYVFCNEWGLQANIRTTQQSIADYNHSRGVNKTSAHLYRHTFAKKWILNGGDIFRLQKILGHSDLTVVREYVNMFSNEVAVDFDKFNPLDNLSSNAKKTLIRI